MLQEADETLLWIELLLEDCGIEDQALERLHHEVDEVISIFTTMVAKVRGKSSGKN